ncbi:hypothetical protein RD792_001746 [Penstemon davidsonii]|uniref:Cytochrome P450 n=1 Tax=Penstemon davidsonii TaxID=160366 RepID=A0ABR0DP88_9LAMI|nr:hypothetical protein RD792_001746 [Penstemon davidsonii]
MDFDEYPLNFTITLALLIVSITFLFILKKSKAAVIVNWPPGPKPLPIIGNIHQLSALPFRSFRDLAKQYGPIMHLRLGQVPTIVVSSPEIAKEMLKEHDPSFADRPQTIALKIMWYNYKDIAFSPYGNYWRQMRKICIVELLSAKMVRAFASIRNDEVSRLVKSIQMSNAGEAINLTDRIFSLTSSITCRAAFGKVSKDNELLIKLLKEGMEMAGGFEIADLYPTSKIVNALSWGKWRLVMMRRKLDVIFDAIIDEHKVNLGKGKGSGEFGNEDLIDVLLRIKDGGELEFPIYNDNIKAVIFDMFSAGTDTSSTLIDWTMVELMRNPRVMEKAQAEVRQVFKDGKITDEGEVQKLKYLKNVIREALRLHPPVPLLPRASREERVIKGYTIPSKVKVLVNNWAMQRDPKYWTNPESFEPERFETNSKDFIGGDFEYLPFGTGRRMCPGMTFGLASVDFPIATLLYHFNWKLPGEMMPKDIDMIESPGITALRKDNLFVVPTPAARLH